MDFEIKNIYCFQNFDKRVFVKLLIALLSKFSWFHGVCLKLWSVFLLVLDSIISHVNFS